MAQQANGPSTDSLDPHTDFQDFSKTLFSRLVQLTKLANNVPTRDISFYRNVDPSFASQLDDCSSGLLKLSNRLVAFSANESVTVLQNVDQVNNHYHLVVDVMDGLLERVDAALDELKPGSKSGDKLAVNMRQSAPIVTQVKQAGSDRLDYRLIHAQNIARPQLKFKDGVDNSATSPFTWKLASKPNAQISLEESLTYEDPNLAALTKATSNSLPNPYAYEISHVNYPSVLFEHREPEPYLPFDTTSAEWIDTPAQVGTLLAKLRQAPIIAVDLEYHSHRSFQGFTCLMQISTRTEDFLVDTLAVREHLQQLNEVFTDPKIVKVFHGAESDVKWLQQDFGLYLVGLFDTYHASKVLGYPHHSLAYLLDRFCQVVADKKYQLADWRIRPLPSEMADYARSDTHYLLYIFDRMRNELVAKSAGSSSSAVTAGSPTGKEAGGDDMAQRFMRLTLQRSEQTALQTYVKPGYDAETGEGENGWRHLLSRYSRTLHSQQLAVFRALHAWRDRTAREEDESLRYVLPGHMLLILAGEMPTEAPALIGLCNPTPPLVRMYAADLAALIGRTMAENPPTAELAGRGLGTAPTKSAKHIRFGLDGSVATVADGVDSDLTHLSVDEFLALRSGDVVDATPATCPLLNPEINAPTLPTVEVDPTPPPTKSKQDKKKKKKQQQASLAATPPSLMAPQSSLLAALGPMVAARPSAATSKVNKTAQTAEDLRMVQLVQENLNLNVPGLTTAMEEDQPEIKAEAGSASDANQSEPEETMAEDEAEVDSPAPSKSNANTREVVVLANMEKGPRPTLASSAAAKRKRSDDSEADTPKGRKPRAPKLATDIIVDKAPEFLRTSLQQSQPATVATTASTSQPPTGDQPSPLVEDDKSAAPSNKKQKNNRQKNKQKNKNANGGGAAASKEPPTNDPSKPFDYSAVQSTADITDKKAAVLKKQRQPGKQTKKNQKKKGAQSAGPAGTNFDPYRQVKVAENADKPVLRTDKAPKSGNRTMSYQVSK
ncbi:exosome nuclease subunit [Dimargaris cristalligena]|nr:exosome nuclease subunit [Dimargaris cristalligena]